jgi:hypothetical protein
MNIILTHLKSSALFLNYDLFRVGIVADTSVIKESLVEESLQKGKIISFPFLKGYTDVLCVMGAINIQR